MQASYQSAAPYGYQGSTYSTTNGTRGAPGYASKDGGSEGVFQSMNYGATTMSDNITNIEVSKPPAHEQNAQTQHGAFPQGGPEGYQKSWMKLIEIYI